MEYDHILIRYGELSLKGKNTKKFVIQLQENIKEALKNYPKIKVTRTLGRLFVILNGQHPSPIIKELKNIFGIYSFSLAIKVQMDEESIKKAALYALKSALNVKTFKVNVKRANKQFPIKSQEMNRILGTHLLKNTEDISVDVHTPDVEIKVEIRENHAYITSSVIKGAGGLPIGTAGKSLLLLSGGIDSPVAGYLMMKRGVQLEMIHFHSPPFTSERAKQKVFDLTKILTHYGSQIKIHVVPFTKLQQEIFKNIPERFAMTVMRRMMLIISERLANKKDIKALITGESVGQVASQTLASMNTINEVTNLPILRPLISFDKEDIIQVSKNIGTYETSIQPYEDCCTIFVPKSPATSPKRSIVNALEKEYNFTPFIENAIQEIETFKITHQEESDSFSKFL